MATLSETLEEITLFKGMTKDDLDSIASNTVIRQFPKNTVVVSQGDETDSFYVILQGKVDVFLHNDKGKEIIINTLGECEAFGELAPLGRIPRQASIITTEDSTGRRSRETTRCTPLVGRIWIRLLGIFGDQAPVALTTFRARTERSSPDSTSVS